MTTTGVNHSSDPAGSLDRTISAIEALRNRNQRRSQAAADLSLDAFAEVFAGMAASKIEAEVSVQPAESESVDVGVENTSEEKLQSRPSERIENQQTDHQPRDAERETSRQPEGAPEAAETVDRSKALESETPIESAVTQTAVEVTSESRVVSADQAETDQPELAVNTDETALDVGESRERRETTAEASGKPVAENDSPVSEGESSVDDTIEVKPTEDFGVETAEASLTEVVDEQGGSSRRRSRESTDHQPDADSRNQNQSETSQAAVNKTQKIAAEASASTGVDAAAGPAKANAAAQTPAVAAVAAATPVAQTSGNSSARNAAVSGRHQVAKTSPTFTEAANRRATSTAAPKDAKPADASETMSRVKLVQRVANAFAHLRRESGQVRMRLATESLGSVAIEMQIRRGQVDASVIAESEAAGATLREHLPELRARLEASGLKVERLDVQTETDGDSRDHQRGRGDESSGDRPLGDQAWDQRQSGGRHDGERTTADQNSTRHHRATASDDLTDSADALVSNLASTPDHVDLVA